jgi:predicted aminopeptidase
VFAPGDTMFNESFATAVERIGGEKWLAEHASPQAREEFARGDRRRLEFRELTTRYRDPLAQLYTGGATDAEKRAGKAALMAQLRADYETMKRERWGGFSGYDGWFARANNASFGVQSAYNLWVPAFERLYEREGRDFHKFYAAVRRLAALPAAERRAALVSLAPH